LESRAAVPAGLNTGNGMSGTVTKPERVAFYIRNIIDELAPQFLFRARLAREITDVPSHEWAQIAERVHYCNKLAGPVALAPDGPRISTLSLSHSYYYYDLMRFARRFPRSYRLDYIYGDVIHVPETPSIVKSRPIDGDNVNSVMMKMEALRHYRYTDGDAAFEGKAPRAVWRGWTGPDHRLRATLVKKWHGHPSCDIGHVRGKLDGIPNASFMSSADQLRFRYIISIEGVDVATNLKWILSSNSVCLMPKSLYETWFMEGALKPGVHFGLLQPDMSNLLELIDAFEADPAMARDVMHNAHAHVARFRDERIELVVGLLVLYKYFKLTGQMDADPRFDAVLAAAPTQG
jgi:hypothetical protein